jgi:tetratricopeptide (TPR) repeat protein
LKEVLSKVKDRNVIQSSIIYSGVIWGFIQVIDFLSQKFEWNVGYVKAITIIGFGSIPASIIFFFFRSQERSFKKQLLFYTANLLMIVALFIWIKPITKQAVKISDNYSHIPTPEASDWYTKGKFRLSPENRQDVDSCIIFFQKAIQLDSIFSEAYAQLSIAYSIKNYFIDPKGGYSEKAFVAATRSLSLNPTLAEGHFAHAYCIWTFDNKFPHETVIRGYKKAIRLNPDLDEAYHQLAIVYLHVGLYEKAIELMNKAFELNPINNFTRVDKVSSCWLAGDSSKYLEMIENFKLLPDKLISSFRISIWSNALIVTDQDKTAKNLIQMKLEQDSSDIYINSTYAILLAKEGNKKGALKIIDKLAKSDFNTGHFHHVTYNLGVAYAWLGNKEKAMDKLIWTTEHGFPSWTMFQNDPLLRPLHGYAPFEELLKKLKNTYLKFDNLAEEE